MESNTFVKGKPVRLFVLDYGLFKVHTNGRIIGICGYLIQTDHDENILIDTGFPKKYYDDIERSAAEDNLGEFGEIIALNQDNRPEKQLALAGVRPDEITHFVTSHTHIDHIGGLADFPQAPLFIAAAERQLDRPLYWRGAQPMTWPKREYVELNDDVQFGPDFSIMHVPGHAPGQLAFLVRLPETGAVLLTSDAISRPEEIDERFATASDPKHALESANRLMELANRESALVIYGHSPEQWGELNKAPASFD